jgi:hypothetical protein
MAAVEAVEAVEALKGSKVNVNSVSNSVVYKRPQYNFPNSQFSFQFFKFIAEFVATAVFGN